jgi:hypothetical protein
MRRLRWCLLLALLLDQQQPLLCYVTPRGFRIFASEHKFISASSLVALAGLDNDCVGDRNDDGATSNSNKASKNESNNETPRKRRNNRTKKIASVPLSNEAKKEIIAQASKTLRNKKNFEDQSDDDNILDIVNPFKAGKKLRNVLESLTRNRSSAKSIYLDDRIGVGMSLAERNPSVKRQSDYTPEVLVIGATGEIGRLVVRRLLLDGNVRVRVLVRDLYSNMPSLMWTK